MHFYFQFQRKKLNFKYQVKPLLKIEIQYFCHQKKNKKKPCHIYFTLSTCTI